MSTLHYMILLIFLVILHIVHDSSSFLVDQDMYVRAGHIKVFT